MERIFDVEIEFDKELIAGKKLDYASWRINHEDLELSLASILSPFDLVYQKESDSLYSIKSFRYYKISEIVAADKLSYLRSLYDDKNSWEKRKELLKNCMVSALKLQQAPKAPESPAILTPIRIYRGYSVENIALEVVPGVYMTGSVYKPYPLHGKKALILSPNGHFSDGRYRESQQVRSATLARMGAVVVSYDLFGWGESELQFPYEYHRTSIAQTIQVLNGLRLLDFFLNTSYIDPARVGVTGGSGGGSHTLFLTALDERIAVSVPAVMVSAHHSGGCPCESGQPIHLCGNGTSNAEIAAMAAPRPQLIISDGGDWTRNVPETEFPFVKRIYGFYDAEERLRNAHFPEEGHDYGYSKRMAMYPFMARYLDLDLKKVQTSAGKIDESLTQVEEKNTMKVFGDEGEQLPGHAIKEIEELHAMFGEEFKKK